MIFHDISRDIGKTLPYPGDRKTEVKRIKSINDFDNCTLSELSFSAHIATHIDAPMHYCRGGDSVGDMELSIFFGECTVLTISGALTGEHMDKLLPHCKKRILLHGEGKAYISSSAVNVMKEHGIVLVGTDADTIALDFEEDKVHYELLNNDIAILENVDLRNIKDGVYVLSAFPLKISGCEASPCRAVLIEGQKMFWL